jgi:hypothetical protein
MEQKNLIERINGTKLNEEIGLSLMKIMSKIVANK